MRGSHTTTHARIGDEGSIRETCPALTDAIQRITDPQVRNRATIGGSLCRNDPAADLPAVALALDAMIEIVGSTGPRTVPAGEFLVGPSETLAKRGDVVTEVLFPGTAGAVGSAYEKFKNPATGLALCGIAALLRRASGGAIRNVEWRQPASPIARFVWRRGGSPRGSDADGGYLGRGRRAKRRGSAFRLRSFRIERISHTPVHVLTKRALMRALNRSGAN